MSQTLASQATSACRQKWNGKSLIEANAIKFLCFLTIFDQYPYVVGRSLQKKKPISDQEFLTNPKNPLKKSYL